MSNMTVVQTPEITAHTDDSFGSKGLLMDFEKVKVMQTMAEVMATAKVTVPAHLAGKAGDCLAIIMQAAQWGMNPFAVAQKTHVVNGILGYEAQLVNAVVCASGAIIGGFSYEYQGEGANIACRVGAVLRWQKEITWGEWLNANSVTTKNSPIWKTNPKQQLGYLQVKNWSRLYVPGAILGVYTPDEIEDQRAGGEIDMGTVEAIEAKPTRTEEIKAKIGAKKKDDHALANALKAIKSATTTEQLTEAAKLAASLVDDEKTEAREAYKARLHDITPHPVITYAEICDKLHNSADADALAVVADLIGEIADEGQRKELGELYQSLLAKIA